MIDKKKINRVTNIDKFKVKSVVTVSAQNNKLLYSGNNMFTSVISTGRAFVLNEKHFIIDRIVILLLMAYGLRISEVLSIRESDIKPSGTIFIRGKKGSNDRLVSGLQFSEWLFKHRVSFVSLLQHRNRWFYYRLFKRLGIYKTMTGNKNASVTHLFRYQFIHEMQEATGNIDSTQNIVGHRLVKNTKRYEKKIK